MAENSWAPFDINVISVTLKFGFYQNRIEYPTVDPSVALLQRLYRDAEQWIREIAVSSRNPQMTGRYKMTLFRIPATEFTMVPITQIIDIEQNSLIEVVILPIETNRNPHAFSPCKLHMSTNCPRCSRFIAGLYKQGYRCRQCRMTFHKECAALLVDDCPGHNNRDPQRPSSLPGLIIINPYMIPYEGSTKYPTLLPPLSPPINPSSAVIEKGIFPACRLGSHIYQRYAFFLTRDTLSMTKNIAAINAPQEFQAGSMDTVFPLLDISNLIMTHFVKDRDDIFEIHASNRPVISVGKKTDSDALQMETAQFYSFVRDQWETLINAAPPPSPVLVSTEPATVVANPVPQLRMSLARKVSIFRLTPQGEGNKDKDFHELYCITNEKIGQGQFGRVVGAFRKSTQQEVAIKIIEKTNCSEKEIAGINQEINNLYKFNHMNILKLEAYFERNNAVYLVTERMETDMCKYINKSINGYLDENTSRMLIYQVIIALRYLHKNNYGHLDVKCENILLTLLKPIPSADNKPPVPNGAEHIPDYPLVKLADFGYSRIIGEHSFRKSRVGTKIYNAPEIYQSPEGYNRLADMWSVGIVLYAALSGTMPYAENEVQNAETIVRETDRLYSDNVWKQVSTEVKDLISNKLLVVQAASRIRPNDALFHDWFTDYPLFKNLREIEKRTKHLLSATKQPPPSLARWLTSEREDLVWTEYNALYSQASEQQNT